MDARFSKPVMPGDDLAVSMWLEGDRCHFQSRNQDGAIVIDQGVTRFA
jgi:acyl dehydratase